MDSRRNFILIILSIVLLAQVSFGQDNSTRINDYDMTVNLDTANGQLNIRARLSVEKFNYDSTLILLLSSAVSLESVFAIVEGTFTNISSKFIGKDTLQIEYPSSLVNEQKFFLDFYYTYPIGKEADSLLLLDRGHRWYPMLMDNIAKLHLSVSAPGDYEMFSAGDMNSMTKTDDSVLTVWETAMPAFKIPLIISKIGYYKGLVKVVSGDKELALYYSSADSATAQAIIDEAGRAFEYFSEYIGKYGHNSLRLIEVTQFPGVNIGTGIITFGRNEYEAFKIGKKDGIDLAVADQWMGAGIFAKFPSQGFWFMSVSIPHYLRMMYLQKVEGEEIFLKNLNDSYDAYRPIAGTGNDIPIYDVDFLGTKEKGAIIYGKGPYAVNIIRNQLGNEVWQKLWRNLYREYKGKVISYDQLIDYIGKYDKKREVASELDKMVKGSGLLDK
jgi:hypothetical protein